MQVRDLKKLLEGLDDAMRVEFFDCTFDRRCPVNRAKLITRPALQVGKTEVALELTNRID